MSKVKSHLFVIHLLVVFLSIHQSGYSQDNTIGRVSIASPNAASLGKYGDIPVSYHTGIPQIDIPIYTVKSGSLQLPVSLSYHAGGLKVQEQASWVGAGWTLNAGGVITRTVNGAPDDRGLNAAHCTSGHFADYGYNNYLFTPGSGSCGSPPCPVGATNPADDVSICTGVKDGEPDLYFFNFNGHVGKFYFSDDRTPIIVPEQDFRIVPIYPYTSNQVSPIGIVGFIITTPDGVNYYFGKNQSADGNIDATEITTDLTASSPSNTGQGAVSSWFLNKIVSADAIDSIKLIYQQDNLSYYSLSMFPVPAVFEGDMFSGNKEYDLLKNFVKGVRLSKISFANGEVDLNPGAIRQDVGDYNSMVISDVANTQSPALGSIAVTDNNGYCKKDTFYTSYFQDNVNSLHGLPSISSDAFRLRLDSIQEISCDGSSKVPPYRFTYFPELVPRKLSFGMDHWGFYNGGTMNSNLIPTYYVTAGNTPSVCTGADRDAHWPAMRGGALQQIVYPTGGSTQFDFEPNDTYCQYNTYTTRSWGFSAGYDGSNNSTSYFTTPASSGTYMLVFSSNMISSSVSIQFSGAGAYNIGGGETDTFYVNLTPSTTYTISTTIGSPQTGKGVSGTFIQFIPTAVAGNVMVGGLRIKTITNNDGLTPNNIVTSYTYNTGGTTSSGILYSRPVYVQVLRNDIFKLVGPPSGNGYSANGCINADISSSMSFYKSPVSVRPMSVTQGNHIGYNQVQVSQTNNGYSIYRYYGSNFWDYNINDVCTRNIDISSCSATIPSFPAAPLPFDFMRGELKYEGHFNQNGQILKDAWYFPKYMQDSILTPGLSVQTASSGFTVGSFLFGAEYNLQSAAKIKDSVVSTQYDPLSNNYLTTTNVSYYSSPFHRQQTRKVTTMSSGDSLATNLKYVADFRIANCDAISNGWHNYFSAYVADSLNFYSQLNSCTNTNGWNCRWLAYQQYRFNKSTDRKSYVSLRRTNYTDAGNLFSACLLTAENNSDTVLRPILRLQDEYDIAPIEVSEWKNQNLRQASFTKYDTSLSPVGFAYPGRTQVINLQASSSTFTNSLVSGNTISRDSRYLDETWYKFSKGKPQQVTPHSGVTSTFIWDYLNTEPIAKVSNATADQVAYTSFEADGGGNWSIGSVVRDGVNAMTGKQSYNLSNGACSKSGLLATNIYIVSYWSKTGTSYSVTGNTGIIQGKTINGWTYFEHSVTGVTTVSVSGIGNIDELRLYPAAAQMTTYTYQPIVGMTSTCDIDNRVTYYSYDAIGRLKVIRDQDGNVVKEYDYQYQIPIGFFNVAASGSFIRSNCATNYTGTTVTYTVPAKTYFSLISQAYVDAQAQNDVNTNGQAYANANGTCTPPAPVTIMSTNASHLMTYNVNLTNTATNTTYSYSIPYSGGAIGTVPPGVYNISISKSGSSVTIQFNINCNSLMVTGVSATFPNVTISASSCNTVTIDYAN